MAPPLEAEKNRLDLPVRQAFFAEADHRVILFEPCVPSMKQDLARHSFMLTRRV